jgi:tripartite-type tricarboxylate transporter receptor subunit TctC
MVTVACFAMPAAAEDAAAFYRGKQVQLVIGHWPGSANDLYGRALTRHMGRHIPGNPVLVPQNMPGAGSVKAANWLYAVAAKDGSVLGMFTSSAIFEPMLGNTAAVFDPKKFTWIGNMDESVLTCIVSGKSGVEKYEDLMKREILFGATSAASIQSQFVNVLAKTTGIKVKLIHGYKGANDIPLAMERGEVQGQCAMPLSRLKTEMADDWKAGKVKPIIQLGIKPSPDLPGVAHVYDYAKTESDRQVFDLIFGRNVMGRPILAPPSLPEDRVRVLRTAFLATMKDKAFLADAAKLKLDINPSTGEDVATFFGKLLAYPKSVVDRAQELTRE